MTSLSSHFSGLIHQERLLVLNVPLFQIILFKGQLLKDLEVTLMADLEESLHLKRFISWFQPLELAH